MLYKLLHKSTTVGAYKICTTNVQFHTQIHKCWRVQMCTNVYKCSQMFPLHNLCSRNPGLPTPVPSHPHYNNAPSPPQLTMVMIMVSPIKHCKKSFSFFKGFLIFQSITKKRWGTTYRPARFIDASDYYLNFLLICY